MIAKTGNGPAIHQQEYEKLRYIYTVEYPQLQEQTTDWYYNMNEPQKIMLRERNLTQEFKLYDSIYMKF